MYGYPYTGTTLANEFCYGPGKDECLSCREGWYMDDDGVCTRCPSNCRECTNQSTCTVCPNDADADPCSTSCDPNILWCANTGPGNTIKCEGSAWGTTSCAQVPSGDELVCFEVDMLGNECYTCQNHSQWQAGPLIERCSDTSQWCHSTCESCYDITETACLSCAPGWELVLDDQCKESAPDPYSGDCDITCGHGIDLGGSIESAIAYVETGSNIHCFGPFPN